MTEAKNRKKANLRHLKKYLQKGEIAEIAAEVGISTWQASQVIAGHAKNFMFLTKLIDRVERNKSLYEKAQAI